MKKLHLLLLITFSSPAMMYAQSIAPQVVASGGDFISSASGSISYTVGEPVTTTITGGGHTVTQGFQQPTDILIGILDVEKEAFGAFSIYPVPAIDKLWFGYEFPEEGSVSVELFDVIGQKLDFNFSEGYSTGKVVHSLDCTRYAAGNYVISVNFTTKSGDVKTLSKKFPIIN